MIESVKEVLAPVAVNNARHPLPMWMTDVREGNELVQLTGHLLKEYKDRLNASCTSAKEAIPILEKQISNLKKEIEQAKSYDARKGRKLLSADVTSNKKIVGEMLSERKEYIAYLTKILSDADKAQIAAIVPKGIFKEILAFIVDTFSLNLKIHVNTVKQMEMQYNNLVDVDEMTDLAVLKKVDSKIKILKDDLSILENELANKQYERLTLSNKVEEVDNIIEQNKNGILGT